MLQTRVTKIREGKEQLFEGKKINKENDFFSNWLLNIKNHLLNYPYLYYYNLVYPPIIYIQNHDPNLYLKKMLVMPQKINYFKYKQSYNQLNIAK